MNYKETILAMVEENPDLADELGDMLMTPAFRLPVIDNKPLQGSLPKASFNRFDWKSIYEAMTATLDDKPLN